MKAMLAGQVLSALAMLIWFARRPQPRPVPAPIRRAVSPARRARSASR